MIDLIVEKIMGRKTEQSKESEFEKIVKENNSEEGLNSVKMRRSKRE